MNCKICWSKLLYEKAFGIELVAETKDEDAMLRRFWDSGVKINGITPRDNGSSLQLTFADLIKR